VSVSVERIAQNSGGHAVWPLIAGS